MKDCTMRSRITARSAGVRILPTRSTSFDGVAASQYVRRKKMRRKIGSAISGEKDPRKGFTAISNDTVPVRGAAKQGPIARYETTE